MANADDDWEYPGRDQRVPNPNDNTGGYDPGPESQPGGEAPPPPPGAVGDCGPGTFHIDIDANGNKKPAPDGECVDQAEASRRNKIWIQKNPGTPAEGSNRSSSSGGSGGGGGGTVPFPAQEKYVPSPQDIELDATIMQGVRDALSGKLNPYGPTEIARAKAAHLQAARGGAAQAKVNVNRDAIRRGLSRSGIPIEQAAAIDRAAGADYSTNIRETLRTAVTENYKAKVAALERAQSYLGQRQQVALAGIRNTLDFQIANAQNSLAAARLRQEREALELSLANALRIAEMGNETQLAALLAQYSGRTV